MKGKSEFSWGSFWVSWFCVITSVWYFLLGIPYSALNGVLWRVFLPQELPFLQIIFGVLSVLGLPHVIPCAVATKVLMSGVVFSPQVKSKQKYHTVFHSVFVLLSCCIFLIVWVALIGNPIYVKMDNEPLLIKFESWTILGEYSILVIMLFLRIVGSIHRKKQQQKEQTS